MPGKREAASRALKDHQVPRTVPPELPRGFWHNPGDLGCHKGRKVMLTPA